MSGGDAGRRRVVAGELHDVGAVEAGGADADEQLPVLGLRIGVLGDLDPAVADGGGTHRAEATPQGSSPDGETGPMVGASDRRIG